MSKLNLKAVFSAPLVIFSPLRKLKIDGFLSGLLIGAIFSLLVNMVTVQVQELIQKQRILEAIENEIMLNMLHANNISKFNSEHIVKKDKPNVFHNFYLYTNDLWTQSTEPLQYVAQLNQEVQIKVHSYYTSSIRYANSMISKYEKIAEQKLANCYETSNLSNEDLNTCDTWYWNVLDWEADTAESFSRESMEVLTVFHPTQDRLKNPILRLFMGNKSVRILSGK
ncbi:MAG: hypothetical protein WC220_00030 [Pedobacter sp.]|jgi:hypothetical protein